MGLGGSDPSTFILFGAGAPESECSQSLCFPPLVRYEGINLMRLQHGADALRKKPGSFRDAFSPKLDSHAAGSAKNGSQPTLLR